MAYPLTLGAITFFLAVIWGRPLINWLIRNEMGKKIRVEEPGSHQMKMGTPTMGGLMVILPVIIITGLLNFANLLGFNLIGQSVLVPMGTLVAFGILGLIDDLEGIRGSRVVGEGIMARTKASWQVIFALIIAVLLYIGPTELRSVAIPGIPQKINIGILYIGVAAFLIVGFSNAVNLTDGLDGLAGSLAAVAYACYGVIAYLQGQVWLAAFCFTMVGALLAFLWFNAHPAELFMGDVGSLAIGGTLAVVALMTGQWLLLPIVGAMFVAEALSVTIQVSWFKFTKRRYGEGRRVFKMSPLHYHFELKGWSETQVMQRFFLCGILAGMLGVALALI
ncbi:MAG: phospho-N-acetylmuramoyl-pentapeptide-transferase [Anaerolineae bacterium]|nr:phospho-N-acetylmuramoyl-pentapeptide-transferase [Anaerolineae bacterium]MCB0245062.1 phospho-N-acetylmuramoyl-pentapeptide-transferase [Anaerolineae bacterium]MCB0247005.1 phospho-N-acetylmuramoyl-pentapeptide-transferase [Anaerolineae bacterium]MCB9130446.1 phospho-N-acetylmuramoyl-pentapeptide-transferase [Anaerolineales bacterium]MCO5242304.1 phospho-N-acetylmuramoyl-pentapeptide-transferase [Anaerolineae bacterium]